MLDLFNVCRYPAGAGQGEIRSGTAPFGDDLWKGAEQTDDHDNRFL